MRRYYSQLTNTTNQLALEAIMNLSKRKLFLLFGAKAISMLAALCCFFPLIEKGIAAYENRAVREYAGTTSAFATDMTKSVDATLEAWEGQLVSNNDLSSVGTNKIQRIDLVRRFNKMKLEFVYCYMCESDPLYIEAEANAKIAKVNAAYSVYRQRMVALHGEAAVADEELRNQSMDTQVDQNTWSSLLWLLMLCYLASCLAQVPFLMLKAKLNGYSVFHELITPDRIPVAALGYLVFESGYPHGNPIHTIQRFLAYATWTLMSVVSWGVGGAAAQGQNATKTSGKNGSAWVITTDARNEKELVDGSGNTITLRTLLVKSGNPVFLEAFMSDKVSPAGETSSFLLTPGMNLLKKQIGKTKLTVNAIGGFRFLRSESAATGAVTHQTRGVVGAEVFVLGDKFQFYHPADRFEFGPKGMVTYLSTSQLLGRASPGRKWWAGAEGNATKTWSRPASGYVGGVVAFDPKPGERFEFAVFKSLQPDKVPAPVSFRVRWIHNFAF